MPLPLPSFNTSSWPLYGTALRFASNPTAVYPMNSDIVYPLHLVQGWQKVTNWEPLIHGDGLIIQTQLSLERGRARHPKGTLTRPIIDYQLPISLCRGFFMSRSHPSVSHAHTRAASRSTNLSQYPVLIQPLNSFELSNGVQFQLGCSIILLLRVYVSGHFCALRFLFMPVEKTTMTRSSHAAYLRHRAGGAADGGYG